MGVHSKKCFIGMYAYTETALCEELKASKNISILPKRGNISSQNTFIYYLPVIFRVKVGA